MGAREYDAAVAEAAAKLIALPEWVEFVRANHERNMFYAGNPSDDLSLEASHLSKTLGDGNDDDRAD